MTTTTTTLADAYRILCEQIEKRGSAAAELIQGMVNDRYELDSLADFHQVDIIEDDVKIGFYRECVRTILGLEKPKAGAAPASESSLQAALFTEMCELLRKAGPTAQKQVAAHLRTITGQNMPLPVYNNHRDFTAADKIALYRKVIAAVKTGEALSKSLQGMIGAGDKRVEEETATRSTTSESPSTTEGKSKRSVPAVKPPAAPLDAGDDEAALLTALAQRLRKPAGVDESVVRRICEEVVNDHIGSLDIPGEDEIKSLAGEAMNNGHFPESRVKDLIAKEIKAAAPTFDLDTIVKPKVDELLGLKLTDFLKRGPAALKAAPKKVDEGDLASYVPDIDPTYIVPNETKRLLEYVKVRSGGSPVNVIVVGPHGCGKTTLAEIFAAQYKMPMLVMDCANIREKRDWFGYKYTEGGSVLWHRSQFDRCLSEGGHVIVLDELPRTTDEIRNTLFPLLDYRRSTFLEERGDYIEVGKNTVIFVTANEGMAYTGCSQLDLALDDRLGIRVEVNYLSEKDEADVLVKRTGIDKDNANKLAQVAATIRSKAIGLGATLTKTVSTRRLIEAAESFKALGVEGLTYTLTNHFNAEGGTTSERAQVLLMVQGKFKA